MHSVVLFLSLFSSNWKFVRLTVKMLKFVCQQVFLGQSGGRDVEGNELPRLVYVSREKRPGYNHHKKAGAMNALVKSLHLMSFIILLVT